jgi:hypothetical protein
MKRIISLTILPSRLSNAKATLDSLLDQDKAADEICVWLPKNAKRDEVLIKSIPQYLKQEPIRVEMVDDVGPATKLIPALRKYWNEKETIIVTADDDQIYPKGWFGGLVRYSEQYESSCLGYRGRKFLRLGGLRLSLSYKRAIVQLCHKMGSPKKVDIVTGVWGALYKVKFFDEEVFDLDLDTPMFFTDDIWFSGMMAKRGVARYVVPMNDTIAATDQWTVAALWEINEGGTNNDWSISALKKYFKAGFHS